MRMGKYMYDMKKSENKIIIGYKTVESREGTGKHKNEKLRNCYRNFMVFGVETQVNSIHFNLYSTIFL